jgi:hypothetical protein
MRIDADPWMVAVVVAMIGVFALSYVVRRVKTGEKRE